MNDRCRKRASSETFGKGARLKLLLIEDDENDFHDVRVNYMKIWGHSEAIQRLHAIGFVKDEVYDVETTDILNPPVFHKHVWSEVQDEVCASYETLVLRDLLGGSSNRENGHQETVTLFEIENQTEKKEKTDLPSKEKIKVSESKRRHFSEIRLRNKHFGFPSNDDQFTRKRLQLLRFIQLDKAISEMTGCKRTSQRMRQSLNESDSQLESPVAHQIKNDLTNSQRLSKAIPSRNNNSSPKENQSSSRTTLKEMSHPKSYSTSQLSVQKSIDLHIKSNFVIFNKKIPVVELIPIDNEKSRVEKLQDNNTKRLSNSSERKLFGFKQRLNMGTVSSDFNSFEKPKAPDDFPYFKMYLKNLSLQTPAPSEAPSAETEDPPSISGWDSEGGAEMSFGIKLEPLDTAPENSIASMDFYNVLQIPEPSSESFENLYQFSENQLFSEAQNEVDPKPTVLSIRTKATDHFSNKEVRTLASCDANIQSIHKNQNVSTFKKALKRKRSGRSFENISPQKVARKFRKRSQPIELPREISEPSSCQVDSTNVPQEQSVRLEAIVEYQAPLTPVEPMDEYLDQPTEHEAFAEPEMQLTDQVTVDEHHEVLTIKESIYEPEDQLSHQLAIDKVIDHSLEKPNSLKESHTESGTRNVPTHLSPPFKIRVQSGSFLKVENFLTLTEPRACNNEEIIGAGVTEMKIPRFCSDSSREKWNNTESGTLIPDQTVFSINLLTQNYLVHEISPFGCNHSKTIFWQDNAHPDSKSSNGEQNLVRTFCLDCVIFKETITLEKVDMVCIGNLFTCSICGFETPKKPFLQDHVALRHSKVIFQCPSCIFQADFEALLKQHWDNSHSNKSSLK